MLENRANETERDNTVKEPDRLSEQVWKPQLIADGKVDSQQAKLVEQSQGKRPDAFKEHVQINDRCSLDIYEHHWELSMPKVTVALSTADLQVDSKGQPVKPGKETLTSDKLIMDDTGAWTMRDDQGQQVEIDEVIKTDENGRKYRANDEGIVYYALDPKHPENKTPLKQKGFTNGTHVLINKDGKMSLIRDQDHYYVSKKGTPEFDNERKANRLVVGFDKKNGVTGVFDQDKSWPITKTNGLK